MIGYEMRNFEKKKLQSVTRERCLESCLLANDFECRSVNYNNVTGDCSLSTVDRHALPATNLKAHFAPAGNQHLDYYESNCIQGKASYDFYGRNFSLLNTFQRKFFLASMP